MRRPGRCQKRLLIALGVFVSIALCDLCTFAASGSPQDLIEAIIAGIESSYNLPMTIRGDFETTYERPHLKKEGTFKINSEGMTGYMTYSRKSVEKRSFVIYGHTIRSDLIGEDGDIKERLLFENGKIVQLQPAPKGAGAGNRASIRTPKQMPGTFPFDPRQLGMEGHRTVTWKEFIHVSEVESATMQRSAENSASVKLKTEQGRTSVIIFAASLNFLPTRVIEYRKDGSILYFTTITYRQLSDHIWFPETAARLLYQGGAATTANSANWLEKHTIQIKNLHVSEQEPARDEIDITMPKGTILGDMTTKKVHRVGAIPESPIGVMAYRYWLRITFVALVSLAVIWFFLKRRRGLDRSHKQA